jgi:hypothetical protein
MGETIIITSFLLYLGFHLAVGIFYKMKNKSKTNE